MIKKQKAKSKKIGNIIVISILAILFLQLAAISVYGSSFTEKIIQAAGETYGKLLYGDTKGQINFTADTEEINLGGVVGEKWVKQGNRVTYMESGTFNDASTTLLSFVNPFGVPTSTDAAYTAAFWYNVGTNATSTAISANLDITGVATSSVVITCGAAVDAYTPPVYDLMSITLPTSTVGVYENNMATTSSGFAAAVGSGSRTKILLTKDYSYFNCNATGTPGAVALWTGEAGYRKGVTGNDNTFDGTWSVEIQKNLQ